MIAVDAFEVAARQFEPPPAEHPDPLIAAGVATLAAALAPAYVRRPHLDVISEAWGDIQRGTCTRLAVSLPSQVGKTTTAVDWAIFWWLVQHPTHRVAVVSYGDSLSATRGRAVRRLIEDHGDRYGLRRDPANWAAHDWSLLTGGGMLSVGVGGGFTGRPSDCVSGESDIVTRDDGVLPIAEFVERGAVGEVLSYSHQTGRPEFRRVEAARVIAGRPLVQITTARGRTLRCTPDHRIYVPGRGYVPAVDLKPGDHLRDMSGSGTKLEALLFPGLRRGPGVDDCDLRGLRCPGSAAPQRPRQGQEERLAQALLFRGVSSERVEGRPPVQGVHLASPARTGVLLEGVQARRLSGAVDVFRLRGGVHPVAVRGREERQVWPDLDPLFSALCRQVGQDRIVGPVQRMRRPYAGKPNWTGVLHRHVSPEVSAPPLDRHPGRLDLSGLFGHLPSDQQSDRSLFESLRRPSPLEADAGPRELPVQGRDQLREVVPLDASAGSGTRRWLRGMWPDRGDGQVLPQGRAGTAKQPGRPSRQHRPEGQPAREPRHSLLYVPWDTPQIGDDTVSVVRQLRGDGHTVYDLQVDGNRNFFAGGILVHNCLVVDDPHKDRAEADSATVRGAIHDWWSAVAIPRMAPSAPIVIVATRWHPDDLIGRVVKHEGTVEAGGRWRVISMPALCTDPATDPLGRGAGDPLPHPKIAEHDTAGLLAHWQERRTSMTPRDWQAICQCDPQPPGGTLLTGDELRAARHLDPADRPAARRVGVAVDPSGGGRDTAGIIAGFLGTDDRLWFTHDATMRGPADQWSRAAARLAAQVDADVIVYEANYGGDMARTVIRTAWDALTREGVIAAGRPCPRLLPTHSRRGKVLRAEPVAQQVREGRIWTGAYLPELESEWCTWSPASPESPGRIDASVHLAWALLPPPGSVGAVSSPPRGALPATGLSPLAGAAGGRSGMSPLG